MFDATSPTVAIIPARGGSKGIPRKNLATVAGRPLIVWTLEAVKQAATGFRCVVTTDDSAIAEVASSFGAEVVHRPAKIAADETPTEPALLHVLDTLPAPGVEVVMLLQATSPIRLPGTLDRALQRYQESGATSLVGVVPVPPFLWRGPAQRPTALYDVDRRPRRQDFDQSHEVFRETGSLYLTRVDALRASGNRISGETVVFPMAEVEGLDIDTVEDLAHADRLLGGG